MFTILFNVIWVCNDISSTYLLMEICSTKLKSGKFISTCGPNISAVSGAVLPGSACYTSFVPVCESPRSCTITCISSNREGMCGPEVICK